MHNVPLNKIGAIYFDQQVCDPKDSDVTSVNFDRELNDRKYNSTIYLDANKNTQSYQQD